MATASSASLSPLMLSVRSSGGVKPQIQSNRAPRYVRGLNFYGGLKAHNHALLALGSPESTERCFAKVVSSLKAGSRGKNGGSALSSTCNAVAEIFKIAAIMNGLVLVGVALGFVLLRIEASLEDSE